ncbi:MFS transporter [Georgenia thermotolerans]|uniref:MFS transporter n=1 Tax=Georgenia thermotolerans TaxID=527326 RepID=A0A7J5UU51_9MICO|nr:MFS transporter [Georgenia thermotolerans]KAE8765819.1 MFS transporter [Georgenia thermotolerans]
MSALTARPAAPAVAGTTGGSLRRRAALAVLVSAQFVVMLDTSIVNVALPSVQHDLGLSAAGLAWVVNAYVLTFGALLLLAGRAADVVGRRRMFLAGSAVFTAGTLLAGLAPGEGVLVAARVVQGAGAAALSPAAMSLLLVMFPGGQRARAMSAWGAASTLGGATGVVAGGLVTGTLGWSWVFFVSVPVTLAGLVLAPRLLDGTRGGARRRFDALGAATITGAVLALIRAALAVPEQGWASTTVLSSAALAAVLLAAFVLVERVVADPLVPLELFRSRTVSLGVALGVLGGAARATTFVLVALYLQQALGMAPAVAGLAMVPTSLAGFAVSLALLPRVLRALGPRRSMVVGLVVLAAGHLWLARSPVEALYAVDVLPALLLVATGVALSFTPTTMVIAAGVPAPHTGLASGLAGSGTQVGAALGLAAFTAVATAAGGVGAGPAAGLSAPGFAAAFTAAAVVALVTAALAVALPRR